MRKKAVLLAKGQDDEKVGVSLKIPKKLKDKLQEYADLQSVSMNALITSCIELMLDEDYNALLENIADILYVESQYLEEKLRSFHEIPSSSEQGAEFQLKYNQIQDDGYKYNNLSTELRKYI